MKKLLAFLLVFAMCFGTLAACAPSQPEGTEPPVTTTASAPTVEEDTGLADAAAYVKNIYKTVSEKTPQDFTRVGSVPVGDKKYEVVWTADVSEDLVKAVKNEDGTVTIDVNEEASADTPYVLTATITGSDGRTETLSWNHLLPASLGNDMSAIVDAGYGLADGETLDGTYTLTGKIINVDTAWSSEYKNITVTIAVEGKEDKPIQCYRLTGEDLDAVKALAYGDTITVSGTLKNYKGTIEFDAGCQLLEVVKGTGEGPVAPETYDEIVEEAYALGEGKSLPYTATLTGKVIRIDYGYSAKYGDMSLTFECRGQNFYCYRLTGPEEWLKQVGEGDWITVMGKIKNYYGTVEFDAGCKMIAYTDWNKVEGPEDQLEHIDAALELEETYDRLPYTTTLTGVITGVDTPYSSSDKNITVTISVEGREDTPIQCYRLTGENLEDVKGLAKGDTITVTGTLMKYYEKIEFAEGCQLQEVVKGEGGEEETLGSATLMTEAPKSGDIVLLWNSDAAMAATANGSKMGAVGAVVAEDGTVAITSDMGQLTVSVDGEYYVFSIGGKYLASTGTGNNMGLQDSIDEYAKWTLESAGDNAWYITNAGANYNGNYNQAMEYYNGFTTYGKKETDIYKMKFYYVGEGTSVEIPDEPVVPEEPFVKPTTPEEIVAAAYALEAGKTLAEGPYTLTGVITSVDTAYDSTYKNVTVTIAVEGCEDQPIVCYRLKGDGADVIAAGDTITVTGQLVNYGGTIEFNSGCTLDSYVKADSGTEPETPVVPEEPTPEETVPEETVPEETVPEETVPEETVPEETVPEETVPEEPTAALMTEAPESGDVVLIWNSDNVMAAEASGTKMGAVGAVPAEDGTVVIADGMGQLTVTKDGDYYVFTIDGKYLCATGTGNNLGLQDEYNVYAKWTLESAGDNAWYIISAGANYNGNYNQAMEYYNGFTTYGKKETDIYKMKFYYVGEGTPVELPTFIKPVTSTEIVDAAFALNTGETLQEGPYTLSGVVSEITYNYSASYNNMSLNMTVVGSDGEKTLNCFKLTGELGANVEVGSEIVVTGELTNYNGKIQFASGCTLDFVKPTTPTEIVAAAYGLEADETLPLGPYTLTGVITEAGAYSTQYGNVTVTIAVEGCENQPIVCFRLKGEGADTLNVNDIITVEGELMNYDGTIEFGQGCTLTEVVDGEPPVVNLDELPSSLTYDFSGVTGSNVYLDDNALNVFLTAEDNNNLKSVTASTVTEGNGTGGAYPNQTGFLKSGSSKKAGQLVLTFTEGTKVTKVEIKCYDWYKNNSTPNTVSVNGSTAQNAPTSVDADGNPVPETLTFTLDGTSNVVTIDTANRAFIFEIVVHFAE